MNVVRKYEEEEKPRTLPTSVKLPKRILTIIDEKVRQGMYKSRSEFIRNAISILVEEEFHGTHPWTKLENL